MSTLASPLSLPTTRARVPGFRAAVCLNNAGVTMLERGCFRQGLETLQDAIAVMKDAFHGADTASGVASEGSTQSIEDKLLKSSLRSLKPEVAVGKRVNVHSLAYDGSGFSPDVLRLLQESPAMTCFYPVRIDMVAVECRREMSRGGSDRSSEMDHEAAILLYNFGVANLLLSEASSPAALSSSTLPTGDSRERVRACAVSVFQLSSSIVSRCAQSCEDCVEEADLLQITLLVFHATIQVLVYSGSDDEALLVFDRYESVRRAVAALHASPWYSIPKSVAAAA